MPKEPLQFKCIRELLLEEPELTRDIEKTLWDAANKMRGKIEVHEYKYVVLGLLFLRYLSYAFEQRRKELIEQYRGRPDLDQILNDQDYYDAAGVLYLPEESRWDYIVRNASQPNIAEILDNAIEKIEERYRDLGGTIPKEYARLNLKPEELAHLINLFSTINFNGNVKAQDVFGRIYEYFLGKFTEVEGKRGGQYYTPRSLTYLIVEILDVKGGRIFDPACGSGGFFVSALSKLECEGIPKEELSIYGQEININSSKIAKMNLILRGAEGDIRVGNSYYDDKFFDLKFDYVTSNPPFNDKDFDPAPLPMDDPRLYVGKRRVPAPKGNGNYMWILHFMYHLNENGKAGFVMANGALSTSKKEELEIRKAIVEEDLLWGIVAAPPKLFYNVSLPVSLWFIRKRKPPHMKRKVLFINAKDLYVQRSRRQNVMTPDHIIKIVQAFKKFEEDVPDEEINEIGFAKVATIEDIRKNNYVLTPGRYVGVKLEIDDERTFDEKMREYSKELAELMKKKRELIARVEEVFEALGYRLEGG